MAVPGSQQPLEHMIRCVEDEWVHERRVPAPPQEISVTRVCLLVPHVRVHVSHDSMVTERGL